MPQKIEYIELRFVDLLGRLKSMTVPCEPVDNLEELSEAPVLQQGTSLDGSSVVGLSRVERSDLRLEPDPATLIELPFRRQRTAAVMCFVKEKMERRAGIYHPRDSRGLLHAVCERYLGKTHDLRVKIEPEFHFITRDHAPFDLRGYADTYPESSAADTLLSLASAVRRLGMKPRVIHHETGESQQEIEIDYDDVRRMADHLPLFKNVARAVAKENEIEVTFMPKPFQDSAGNGLHVHIQLWEGDRNIFGTEGGDHLSDTARMFIAGLLENVPAITAIGNPTVNSYKRLVPHHEAPVHIAWGFMNRTVLVRVPLFTEPQKAAVEFRSSDATANPYLLFSALIACGFDGVRRGLSPPAPREENIFLLTEKEREAFAIRTLPLNLDAALRELNASSVLREALGEEMVEAFLNVKREEWNVYAHRVITDWEWQEYQDL